MNFDLYLLHVIGHELSHGLGIYMKGSAQELGHVLEEAKADVFGGIFLFFLADQGEITLDDAERAEMQKIVDCIRQMRMGQTESHALGAVIQLRWMLARGAVTIVEDSLAFDRKQLRKALEELADEFVKIGMSDDYARAKAFYDIWTRPIPELDPLLARLAHIPVNIKPIFE